MLRTSIYYEREARGGFVMSLIEIGRQFDDAALAQALKDELAVNINIKIVEPHTIQRSEGKAVRIVDLRNGEEK